MEGAVGTGAGLFTPVSAELAALERRFREEIEADGPPMSAPMGGLFAAGGKRIRPALVLLAGQLGDPGPQHQDAAMAVEFIHAATLVHDDVIDRSKLRRGMPTVAAALGDEPAIVVGDYYFAKAYAHAAATLDPAVVEELAAAVMRICRAELAQHQARFRYRGTIEEYLERIEGKTAVLLASSAWVGGRLAGLAADRLAALCSYGTDLGLAFQIADDVLDFTAEEEQLGKPVGHDLLEGHATLPLLLAELAEGLPEGVPASRSEVARAVSAVRASGGPARALDTARLHAERARSHLASLPPGPARDCLANLAGFVVERRQ